MLIEHRCVVGLGVCVNAANDSTAAHLHGLHCCPSLPRRDEVTPKLINQRSDNLMVLLHAIEKDTEQLPAADIDVANTRMRDFKRRMNATPSPRAAGDDAPSDSRTARPKLIDFDKLHPWHVNQHSTTAQSGRPRSLPRQREPGEVRRTATLASSMR